MACPNAVLEALDGLDSVTDVSLDLATDRFDIRHADWSAARGSILAAVREAGYEPVLVEGGGRSERPTVSRIDPRALPIELAALFDRAADLRRPVLLDFGSPDCVTCRQMEAVTYPEAGVADERAFWLSAHVDVVEQPEVARLLGVVVMPTSVALDPRGDVLGESTGFVRAADYAAWLADMRAKAP